MTLTDRFGEALGFAEQLHRSQTRKGNDIPYVAHLLAVAATVLEWGGDEDTAIAALLHDAVEDQGGLATAHLIRERFGDRVADLVLACTDSVVEDPEAKAPWEDRKRRYIAKIQDADRDVALITAADKLHNLTAIVRDVRTYGPQTLTRFNAPDRLTWYYGEIVDALDGHAADAPVGEIRARLDDLVGLVDPNRGVPGGD